MSIELFVDLQQQISAAGYSPPWPLSWATYLSLSREATINILRFFFVAATIIGSFTYRRFLGRLLVFLGVWQIHAVLSSFYSPNHQWYPWLYTSFIFLFLPDIWKRIGDRDANKKFLLMIWCAQALILLTYTLSGFWKFAFLFLQVMNGEVHGFAIDGFAYQIASWLPRLDYKVILGEFIIDHPVIGWPIYVGSYFLEFFALWAAVRPSLQKLWATGLVIFHFGTIVVMGIQFMPSILILIILFFNSPFTPHEFSIKKVIYDLPIVGQILSLFKNKPKTIS
jgi:hypothetical protein